MNFLKGGVRLQNVAEVEIFKKGMVIDGRQLGSDRQNGLDLGCEQQPPADMGIMQGLFAQPVTSYQQFPPTLVIEGEGEHAAQLLDACRSQLLVEMDDDLGVASGRKAVAAGFKARTELRKVIDLAVKYNPYRAVFIENRLVPSRDINNAQAPHPETGILFDENTFIVRSAMHDGLAHAMNRGRSDRLRPVRVDNSCNPAHMGLSLHCRSGGDLGRFKAPRGASFVTV